MEKKEIKKMLTEKQNLLQKLQVGYLQLGQQIEQIKGQVILLQELFNTKKKSD